VLRGGVLTAGQHPCVAGRPDQRNGRSRVIPSGSRATAAPVTKALHLSCPEFAMRRPISTIALLLSACFAMPAGRLGAQEPYRLPPQVVVDILDAPPPPATFVSPDRTWLLLADRAAMPTIADLSQPMLRLAGSRINPASNGPFRAATYTGLRLERVADGQVREVVGLSGAKIGWPSWSPDGRRVAFTVTGSAGIGLWVASVDSGLARPLMARALNATLGAPCSRMPDGTELL
jgi:hypothetical protein